MSTHTTEIVHQPTIGYTDLSTDSFEKCLEFEWQGDIVYRDFVLGGFCPGGFCPGILSEAGVVQGDLVLEPYNIEVLFSVIRFSDSHEISD